MYEQAVTVMVIKLIRHIDNEDEANRLASAPMPSKDDENFVASNALLVPTVAMGEGFLVSTALLGVTKITGRLRSWLLYG